ncbi:GAF domain-containing sensor histidine kinase [Actinoalloteichus spitiensis]|uniref:GAF domain-containing sensor histidine kinase n=1 Tax=Actinoalloteichus spitiensis TaxID=252394 RepID=UPI000369616D|nr:histidine kinase [Actinoalloteichus spitiensis]
MDSTLARDTLAAATEITTAAMSHDEPEAVLPLVARRAAALTEADLCLVMVRAEDGSLTVEAAHADRNSAGRVRDPMGAVLSPRSVASRVARRRVPMVVDDVTADPSTAPFVPPQLRGYGPFAVAPFGTRERRLGALAVYRWRGARPFAPTTVEVLAAFAAQAGLAIVLAEGSTARQRVAVYQERERIARDLHDVIVQRLYAAGVQLDLLGRRLAGRLDPADEARLVDTVEQLDGTIGEIRDTVRELRSTDPADQGAAVDLSDSVRAEVATAAGLLDLTPTLDLVGGCDDVPVVVADHARAALREALSNVVRHSGARSLAVELHRHPGGLRLRVTDDGCGIPRGVTRRGLLHLEERAAAAGGRCRVESSPDSGTTVTWEVPLH